MEWNRQTFLGVFLIILGVLGLVVGIAKHHLTETVGSFIMYMLPLLVGGIMLVIEKAGK